MKYLFFFIILFSIGCSNDFSDVNFNKKAYTTASAAPLFSGAQKELADALLQTNVNRNIFRLTSQYWNQRTYLDESRYDYATRQIPRNFWRMIYVRVLYNLKEAKQSLEGVIPISDAATIQKNNQLSYIEIMTVYAYSILVQTYGDVPYAEALDAENTITPTYDDAQTIYKDLISRLEAAIVSLDASQSAFGGADLYYGGDVEKLKKFAYSLLLRMGMLMADVDDAYAKGIVEKAYQGGVMSDNADNAVIKYLGSTPNTHPLWVDLVQSNRVDYVACDTFVNKLFDLRDPRLPIYFDTVTNVEANDTIFLTDGLTVDTIKRYQGQRAGTASDQTTHSLAGKKFKERDLPGLLFSHSEVSFLLAEAKERGYNVGSLTAADYYKNGVEASVTYWVPNISAADLNSYLARPDVNYVTASGTYKEKIGIQKWISFYAQPFEGWTEIRRLDHPKLQLPDQTKADSYPNRFFYPVIEQTSNVPGYETALAALGGPGKDNIATKLFWDKN